MEGGGGEEAWGGSTAELQGGVTQKPPPAPSSTSSSVSGTNTQSGIPTTKSKLPSHHVSSLLAKSRGRPQSPRTSQGSEDSTSLSLAQVSNTGNRIPQQQSSSKKNFGPRSIEGRGRSRTPVYAAPRGGSPYPQSPPPPPKPLPNSVESKGTTHGETLPEDYNQETRQTDPDRLQSQGQTQGQSEGHLESHEQRQLVSRGAGPEGPMAHPVLPHEVFGLWCDLCNRRLVELKRQALRLWMPFASSRGTTTIKESKLIARLEGRLALVSDGARRGLRPDVVCDVCHTPVTRLKQEAIAMVQSLERAQADSPIPASHIPTYLGGSKSVAARSMPRTTPHYSSTHHRLVRQGLLRRQQGSSPQRQQQQQNSSPQRQQQQGSSQGSNPQRSQQGSSSQRQRQGSSPQRQPSGIPKRQDSPWPNLPKESSQHRQPRQHHPYHPEVGGPQAGHYAAYSGNPGAQAYYTAAHPHHPQTQKPYHDHVYARASAKKLYKQMLINSASMNGRRSPHMMEYQSPSHSSNGSTGSPATSRPSMLPLYSPHIQPHLASSSHGSLSPASTSSTNSSTNPSAAASFFARAAQKLNIKSHKKKKHHEEKEERPQFPTNFSDVIRMNPPPAPPALVRSSGRLQNPSTGKVKVMLRICPVESSHSESFLSIDQWKKQVTLYDPAQSGYTTAAHRKPGVTPPKMFAFDAVFSQDDSMPEICANSLVDIIQAVVNGADGCLFCYGHARLGKTYTMIGVDDSPQNLGILPCSIAWLFKLINDQKDQTGARFSVRVSAVEVTGKQEQLKDLLADVASGNESGGNTAPGVYLREDPICGTQLENQSELRAPTAERAAYYLDAAIAARTIPEAEEDARNSHLLFTLHVYQYRVEKNSKGQATGKEQQVAGGRSRLHLIDLGSCSKSTKDGNALSLSALGTVIMALLNGQRHVPHRDSKLTQLMRESLGSLSCRTCMIAHVSPSMQAYNETLQVTQLAAKIHRMKRRKTKFSSTSSDDSSSCSESGPFRPRMRVGVRMGTYGAYSDPDYTSSSEQSCDTVIYVGPGGQALSDRELTDNEGPPSVVPIVPRTRSLPRPSKLASQEYQYPLSEEGEMGGDIPVKQPKTMPKCGATTVASSRQTSKSGSPSRQLHAQQGQPGGAVGGSGIVQLPRKINVSKTKVLQHARMNIDQQDSYNPGWSYREGPAGEAAPGGEQWVDGPGAPQTSAPHEQWIDGPNIAPVQQSWSSESYVYNGEGKPIPLSSVSSSGLVKPSAGEQWVDGPREFQGDEIRRSHGSPHKMTKAEKAHKMWKQMSGKPLPPQRVSSLENWTPQYKSQVPHRDDREHYREQSRERHRDRRPRDLEQPKSGQLRNPHVHHLSTNESRPSSHGSGGESASSSMVAQTSRPSVDMETDQSQKDVGPKGDDSLPNVPVKSFVRDWVEKHSVGPTESPEQSQHGSPSKHASSRHHKSKEVKNPAISAMLYEKENTTGGSAHSSPRSSRKHHHKLKKTALPPSDSTQSRITQWVQQVQEATSTSTEAPFSPNSEAPISEELLAPECHQAMFDSKSPAPPPYEACVGSDAGIDDLDEDIPDVEQQYLDAEKARLESQTSTEVIKDSRDSDHKPLLITEAEDKDAFNKGLDEVEKSSTISKSSDAKILKGKESNSEVTKTQDEADRHQDSLYEMDIDTQFEEIEKDSKLNSTFTSEDDAGLNAASLPKKDIDKVLADSPLTVDIHQQALQVSRTSDEGVAEETCETNAEVTAELIVHAQLSPLSVNADVDSGNASAHSGEHLSPPSSSDDSDKVTTRGRSLCRPSCLRRPDGASNPNLAIMEQTLKEKAETVEQEKDAVVGSPSSVLPKPLYSSTPSATSKMCHVIAGEISPIPKRSVLGHSPEDSSRGEQAESPTKLSKLPLKSPSKDTKVQIKDSKEKSKSKPSILPKPLSRKSKSADRAESTSSSPSKLIPSRFSSKSSTSSKSSKSSAGSASPTKSSSSSRKSEKHSGKHAKSSSPSPSSRPSSVKSAPSRFSSPFFSRLPTSSPSKSSKTQVTSPSKSSTSSSNGGKESRSKIKSPFSSKKESKLPVSKTATSPTGKVPGLPPPRPSGRGTDSDSGNDSGIVKNDKSKRLLSPYSTVTNPRVSTHSSSGHGSDFSTSSAQQVLEKNTKLLRQKEAHLSSGYESMVGQDGEATGTSSGTQDSTSESSAGGRIHGNKVLKKKPPSCASLKSRSRSAPPPRVDSPASVHKDSPVQSPSHNPASPSPRHAWVDTRHGGYDATDETMEIQFYDVDDVERIHKRRKEAAEMQVTEKRKERIQQLLQRQEELKMELAEAKGRLMINKSTWSFDLHVAEQTNWEDPSHLEALEKETSILEKRVDACKARIMMVTCFDANLA